MNPIQIWRSIKFDRCIQSRKSLSSMPVGNFSFFSSICISSLKTIQICKLGKGYNFLTGDRTLSLLVIYPWFSPIVKASINSTLIGCFLWYHVSILCGPVALGCHSDPVTHEYCVHLVPGSWVHHLLSVVICFPGSYCLYCYSYRQ